MAAEFFSDELILVIRYSGERTFDICRELVLRQIPEGKVFFVSERPFEAALRKTYEIGIASGVKWMITLDADVLLRDGAIKSLLEEAEKGSRKLFQLEGLVHDKLMGGFRKAGYRIYRTEYLPVALGIVPADRVEIRPECATLRKMAELGYPSYECVQVYGAHDYEQFYRDVYRKAFVHANKHARWLPQIIERWKRLAVNDDDFRVALRGLYDGLMSLSEARIDVRDYTSSAQRALQELGLQEKQELLWAGEGGSCEIANKIIAQAYEAGDVVDNDFSMTHYQLVKSYYQRLGPWRLVPYAIGAVLWWAGKGLKSVASKE